jgi:hypothetical protein
MAQFRQGGFNRCNGGEHVPVAHKAQVADAKHLALEVILAASQEDIEAVFHQLAQGFRI